MPRATPALLLACSLALASQIASAQSTPASSDLPAFDAVTIKPLSPTAHATILGFLGDPGGRAYYGGNLKMLVEYAFNLQDYQVVGGPAWTNSQTFIIHAVPPENSPSRSITVQNAEPSPDQRLMLQRMLRERFNFKFHLETRQGEVYILTRGKKPLQLQPPKEPAADPRAIVSIEQGDIVDGEAEGENTTTDYMAMRFSSYLRLPVLNQTGITGSYDYNLPPVDPENKDVVTAVLSVVDRLGLKLHRGRGPIQTLVIDHVDQPTEN
jgi:uncharacterized protein (TIGR03435 family)